MPAPSNVQTHNEGATVGKAEHNDTITFTFAGTVNPALVLPGWNGTATAVTLLLQHNSSDESFNIRNASTGLQLTELGSVELHGNYTTGNSTFTNSQMTLTSSNTIRIVLGTASGTIRTETVPAAMHWTTPKGAATESGASDVEF
jgi:hypothetical protein